MTKFYNLDEAAAAISADLHPDNQAKRAEVCGIYRALMYNALCDGALIGRNPDTRHQIDRTRLGSIIAFAASVIRESDLNGWLEEIGNGVRVDGKRIAQSNANAISRAGGSLPGTAKLADDLGPFLSEGRDVMWLKKTLGDLRKRPELKRYRTMTTRPRGALWRPGAVVIWLIKNGHMSQKSGQAALKDNYPDDYDMLTA